jgi:hypothetical protein
MMLMHIFMMHQQVIRPVDLDGGADMECIHYTGTSDIVTDSQRC